MRTQHFFIAFSLAVTTWAQTPARPSSITAVGNASVSVAPDLARVDVSVVTQAPTAQEAAAANATRTGTVIGALQALTGSSGSTQTVGYSLYPVYNNPPAGQNPSIVGYMVTNTVEVSLTDLTKIGKAIDTAIENGANRVQGVAFDLQDRNAPTAQALKTAATRARSQADAIAAGLNVRTGAVLHASQGASAVSPVMTGILAAAPTTPVESGLVIVQASVTLEVAIAP